ncbi:MAG: DUF2442 domain-containing protein [Chloroflexota bacterium]|nr:DUF2442 domain-containing protein [Chloroflexota bacterium]MDE2947459.1 DUF2442 domain-containing protein [Chloroflexota bacterium]
MKKIPFVHDDRCAPRAVRFTESHLMIEMADGRILGLPLYYFPWLLNASDAERQNFQLNYFTVDWEELDEGIDMVAMLTGLYINDKSRPREAVERESAAAT